MYQVIRIRTCNLLANLNLKILLIIITLSCCNQLKAQSNNLGPSIPSPNSASLGLYGEMPVSYFTGVPEISIPLYEIKGKKISLPISMSYHAGGLRPEVHPGWVGNGWNLSAGGAITRKVNGNIDEYQRLGSGIGKAGYYYNCNNLNNSTWYEPPSIITYPPDSYGYSPNFDADTEPDEFDFNFLGYSGKFFLDQTGNWQVQSDNALKVVFNSNDFVNPFIDNINGNFSVSNVSPTFGIFTIIDQSGNQFIFGSKDNKNTAIEYSDVMIPQASLYGASITATSWYLSQIISADSTETINLNYERGPLESQIGFSSTYGGYQNSGSGTGIISTIFNFNNFYPSSTCNISNAGLTGWVIFPVYLVSITMPSQNLMIDFSNKSQSNELAYITDPKDSNNPYVAIFNGTPSSPYYQTQIPNNFPSQYLIDIPNATGLVPFYTNNPSVWSGSNYSTRFIWLKLDEIIVKNTATQNNIRFIDFNYRNIPTARLQLNSLNISDNSNIPIQTYSFLYNDQTPLPAYLTTYTDHWGFNNNSVMPALSTINANQNYFSIRNPDATGLQTKAEILTSITYPTGGTTSFIYEPNTYSSVVYRDPLSLSNKGTSVTSETGIAGGVRIRTITTSDGLGNSMVKNYYYVNGYNSTANLSTLVSSGVLDTKPVYSFVNQAVTAGGATLTYQINSSNPIIPVTSNSSGTLIGYSSVVEQRSDGSYSLYQFSNQDNSLYKDQVPLGVVYSILMSNFPCTSMAFERGKLLYKADYAVNNVNNISYLVSEKFTNYSSVGTLTAANALMNTWTQICSTQMPVCRAAYLMYSYPFLPSSEITKIYSSDGSGTNVTTTTNLVYDQYKNLVSKQITNSKGQAELVTYTYPYNYVTSDPSNPYSAMVSMNNVSAPIEKRVSISGNLISAELYTYQYLGSKNIYNNALYNFEISSPVSLSTLAVTTYSGSGQLSFDSRYVNHATIYYDPFGNLSTVNKTGSDVSSYLYDYGQTLPVAKVTNANNIYASGNNISKAVNQQIFIPFSLSTNYTQTIVVGVTGSVTLSLTYNNPGVSGSSQLNWTLYGPTYATGTLCSATATSTTNCGTQSNSVTINNVQPGSYSLVYDIISCSGFQNYYGYYLNVQYPVSIYSTISAQNDVGYTSFEYMASGDLNYGTGNWSGIVLGNIKTSAAVTGSNYYTLSGTILSKSGLQASQTYIVSYWSDSGPYTVTGSQSVITGATLNFGNWTYYEHVVTNTSTVSVSGSGNIDELRIYPQGGQMTTYTYIPLIGLSSQCDINNVVTYFSYDSFGRLQLIMDKDKNVVKKFYYQYQ